MSKPDKISAEAKKGACYYGIAAYSKVRVGSYRTRFVVDWGGQAKTEKARKTEKAKRQRRQERQRRQKDRQVCSEMFVPCNGRRAVTVQRISQEYGKSALWIVTVPVSVQPC